MRPHGHEHAVVKKVLLKNAYPRGPSRYGPSPIFLCFSLPSISLCLRSTFHSIVKVVSRSHHLTTFRNRYRVVPKVTMAISPITAYACSIVFQSKPVEVSALTAFTP